MASVSWLKCGARVNRSAVPSGWSLTLGLGLSLAASTCLWSTEFNKIANAPGTGGEGGGAGGAGGPSGPSGQGGSDGGSCGCAAAQDGNDCPDLVGDIPSKPESCDVSASEEGQTDCGPTEESCCTTGAVSCGTFCRGLDCAGQDDPSAVATLSNYALGKYEVTVARFRRFVTTHLCLDKSLASTAGAHPKITGSGWQASWESHLSKGISCNHNWDSCESATWTTASGANERKPMNCLSWYEAAAFCAWDGGRLPTEAEWNYAASGGAEQRVYPWSDPDETPAEQAADISTDHAAYGCDNPSTCEAIHTLAEVDEREPGAGRWGHRQLAGNVAEWTVDWIDWGDGGDGSDGAAGYPLPCEDCGEVDNGGAKRAIRGGSFRDDAAALRTSAHRSLAATGREGWLGFRCAYPAASP